LATKASRFALVLLVVAIGVGAGVGAVAVFQGGGPSHRPATPSVAAFRFPTPGAIHPFATDSAAAEPFAEPTSARGALEAFLGAERDGLTARSYALLTTADQQDVGSAAAFAASSVDRPPPVAFIITSEAATPEGEQVSVDVSRRPSLDQFSGFVSARATQVWRVIRQGSTWRVAAEPVAENPTLPPIATAAAVVERWLQASAACDRAGAASLQEASDLIGPEDLVAAPCRERGSWSVAGSLVTLDRAPDVQAFVEAYGPDVGTWTRLVPVRGKRTHFLAAVAPLGDDWRVMGVTSDRG
jgi:hypothetical protein